MPTATAPSFQMPNDGGLVGQVTNNLGPLSAEAVPLGGPYYLKWIDLLLIGGGIAVLFVGFGKNEKLFLAVGGIALALGVLSAAGM